MNSIEFKNALLAAGIKEGKADLLTRWHTRDGHMPDQSELQATIAKSLASKPVKMRDVVMGGLDGAAFDREYD